MPKKLKAYVTNLGFFELAIAAPSMKAALDAWGMTHNAFHQGFAKQTEDPAIVAQTNAKPGVVLRRGVGSTGSFSEDAALPETLPTIRPPATTKFRAAPRRKADKRKPPETPKADRAAIISFEKARREREKQRAKEEAAQAKERASRKAAMNEADSALAEAMEIHEQTVREIERERELLDRRADKEERRWAAEKVKLKKAIERARD